MSLVYHRVFSTNVAIIDNIESTMKRYHFILSVGDFIMACFVNHLHYLIVVSDAEAEWRAIVFYTSTWWCPPNWSVTSEHPIGISFNYGKCFLITMTLHSEILFFIAMLATSVEKIKFSIWLKEIQQILFNPFLSNDKRVQSILGLFWKISRFFLS